MLDFSLIGILSNLPDDYRLSATETGARLLAEIQPGE